MGQNITDNTPQRLLARRLMIRTSLIFMLLGGLILGVTSATAVLAIRSGVIQKNFIQPIKNAISQLNTGISPAPSPNTIATPSGDLFSDFEKNSKQKSKTGTPNQLGGNGLGQPRSCYLYTVTHLDGSTSRLCYSKSDYNQLVNLGYSLSSAKTFYQFQIDGAQRYQDEYDRTKSSVYLDAKASSEQQAQREKDKIGQITGQMQDIERRGY